MRQREDDLDSGSSSAILEALLLGDLGSHVKELGGLGLPALWVSASQLAE